jgi:hypothetical protein
MRLTESTIDFDWDKIRGRLGVKKKICIEVVSQPRITLEGKAQADSKPQHTRQYVSIARGLQRRHRVSDGIVKSLIELVS